jgi:hypothetical protein
MMKRLALALVTALSLTACGGGGGGGSATPPGPTYANTSSIYYLPMHAGNVWTFTSAGSIRDIGAGSLTCSCAINNVPLERLNLVNPDGSVAGAFYFSKVTSSQTGAVLTDLVGVSTGTSTAVQLVTDGVHYGLPIMDDHAFVGEAWSYSNESSTITSVGNNQSYGSQMIRSVNTDAFTGAGNWTWSFAQGVGPTSVSMSGQTITLTSFSIDAVNSQDVSRQAMNRQPLTVSTTPATSADVATLIGRWI